MNFSELGERLRPLGFKPLLESYDTLVRRGDGTPLNPDIHIEQRGWGGPGEATVRISREGGAVFFVGRFEDIEKGVASWVTTSTA